MTQKCYALEDANEEFATQLNARAFGLDQEVAEYRVDMKLAAKDEIIDSLRVESSQIADRLDKTEMEKSFVDGSSRGLALEVRGLKIYVARYRGIVAAMENRFRAELAAASLFVDLRNHNLELDEKDLEMLRDLDRKLYELVDMQISKPKHWRYNDIMF